MGPKVDELRMVQRSIEAIQLDISELKEEASMKTDKNELIFYSSVLKDRKIKLDEEIDKIKERLNKFDDDDKVDELLLRTRKIAKDLRVSQEQIYIRSTELNQGTDHLNKNNNDSSATKITQLPTLGLTVFDGNLNKFLSFWESFETTINSRSDLPDVEKFKYFKSILKGEPLDFAQRYATTSANYKVMLKDFEKEYRQTDELVYINIKNIFDIPVVKKKNSQALRKLVSVIKTALQNLKTLGQNVDQWDAILDRIVMDKIDAETLEKFKFSRIGDHSIPPIGDLLDFIDGVAGSIANNEVGASARTHSLILTQSSNNFKKPSCQLCKKDNRHYINQCEEYLKLSPFERLKTIKFLKLCISCLSSKHFLNSCTNTRRCYCNGRHHSSLHKSFDKTTASLKVTAKRQTRNGNSSRPPSVESNHSNKSARSFLAQLSLNSNVDSVLLATAKINIIDESGSSHQARVLLDTGSQCTSICSKFAKRLNCRHLPTSVTVTGIGAQVASHAKQSIDLKFSSIYDNSRIFTTKALILEKLTFNLPDQTFEINDSFYENLKLADPSFNISGKIDIILGGNIVFDIFFGKNKLDFPSGIPSALETPLGYVLFGQYDSSNSKNYLSGITLKQSPNDLITKLWQLEDVPNSKAISKQDKHCEYLFSKSICQPFPGKYSVDLIFKEYPPNLGNSFHGAAKRFFLLEQRFKKDNNLKINYIKNFNEYVTLGHMVRIENPTFDILHAYLPHHPVIREAKITTKLRIVFDGSFATSNGVSLNQSLYAGPPLQQDIRHLILRCRFFKYVITADLKQMYRQILINKPHQEFLRVLWRDDPKDELKHYKLTTVTFGISSAPFSAIRILHHLADLNEINYPEACKIIKEHFYVDDLITGSNSQNTLIHNVQNLIKILGQAGFSFDKFACNNKTILNKLQEMGHETKSEASLALLTTANTLGIKWNIDSDSFSFNFKVPEYKFLTKRLLLSALAKIYDPLGILSPFLILLKFILQDAWKLKLSWDSRLPDEHQNIWNDLIKNFSLLATFKIPRLVLNINAKFYEIHGFADASIRGYGACIYLLSFFDNQSFESHLLFAKSKVSPTHFISIPKLELCSAHLLASSYQFFSSIFPIKIKNVYFYSDSQIALSWIKSEKLQYKTFVANRVADINSFVPNARWRYINTGLNPADIASRGLTMSKLISSDLWLHGPFRDQTFIDNLKNGIPIKEVIQNSGENQDFLNEIKPIKLISNVINLKEKLIDRFSCLGKIKRTFAYLLIFKNPFTLREYLQSNRVLTVSHFEQALIIISRLSQKHSYPDEYKTLAKNSEISHNSVLKTLTPFFDQTNQVIRVGGRLKHSALSYSTKHPIVLSNKCNFSTLLVRDAHSRLNHADYNTIVTYLRANYWIIKIRSIVKTITNECITCRRFKVSRFQQLMGNLPINRVNPSPIFSQIGIDCAGPFMVTPIRTRGCRYQKYYICIFICFATRAVHIETLSSMTTECFLMSLSRFISRRGIPQQIHSDCGTNFVGCSNELKVLYEFFRSLKNDPQINHYANENHIQWKFNPPSSPHFGSLWESNIKNFKYYLKRSCSNLQFSFEEFYTLIAKIESILNSRPMYPLSDSIADFDILTPGHFITGRPLTSIPEKNLSDVNLNRLSRWELIQNRTQYLWKRWSTSYLHSLQQRRKWFTVNTQPFVGQLILLCESSNPLQWIRGRIIKIYPGSDNLTRVVLIKTPTGEYKRPLAKIAPLLIDSKSESYSELMTNRS